MLLESLQQLHAAYADIMPDADAWWDLKSMQLPTTFWANTLRLSRQALQELLHKDGIETTFIPGVANGLRYAGPVSDIAHHPAYRCGLLQIQEEVAMLAGAVLSPESHHRVLDMCAAPGNKMAQMAVSMGGRGTLIGNDRSAQRIRAAGQLIKRLGLANVSLTIYDANGLPKLPQYFDRILLDAPCSGEGTFRKHTNRSYAHQEAASKGCARLQLGLLRKAFNMLKPGGLLLYATCTLSPWENEHVLTDLMQDRSDVVIKPISMQHMHSTGILSWRGVDFDPRVKHSVRLWPHQNNTGGFFVALLEKKTDTVMQDSGSVATARLPELTDADRGLLASSLAHFGIALPSLGDCHFYSTKKGIVMCSVQHGVASTIKLDATGMLFLKGRNRFAKLTTAAACYVASLVNKNKIDLKADQARAFMRREDVMLDFKQCSHCQNHAYVLIYSEGFGLGIGWLQQQDDRCILNSFYPKSLALS